MLVALFAIPMIVKGLGTEQFGILTIVWMVIGYFGLFDLGLGRALTQLVAEKLGGGEEEEIPAIAWSTLGLMFLLGLVGALVVVLISPWLVQSVLKVPVEYQRDTIRSFYLLAASMPIVVNTAGLYGVLSALQRFKLLNAIRMPLGVFTYLGPLAVFPFSRGIFAVTAVLVVGRVINFVAHLYFCLRELPALRSTVTFRPSLLGKLLGFGGWMTVSNVIGPLMVYLDRFLIGSMLSMAAVAYYATPYEVVTKLWIIPGALLSVMFPAFATSHVQDRERTTALFNRGVKYLFIALFPITLVIVIFAREGLQVWLGAQFAKSSTAVLQWLAVGVFINSLAQAPFTFLQGIGRPDITAKLHVIELFPYLALLWWLLISFGIAGAAAAWTARVILDTVLLFVIANRFNRSGQSFMMRQALFMGGILLVILWGATQTGILAKSALFAITLMGFFLMTWFVLLSEDERAFLIERLRLRI